MGVQLKLTQEEDRSCKHVKNEDGRKYVCEGCAIEVVAAAAERERILRKAVEAISKTEAPGVPPCKVCGHLWCIARRAVVAVDALT